MRRGSSFLGPKLAYSADRPKAEAAARRPCLSEAQAARFRALILPHLDAAYSLARFLSRNPVAAEDIVQDAFLRAFRAFPGFYGQSPKAWLFAIVRNCVFDWAKANRDTGAVMNETLRQYEETPEALVGQDQEDHIVRTTVENLPEPFRETLVLRELEELSYKEIATLTEVPIGTVMSRLARAREMLAKLLLPLRDQNREAGL